MGTSDELCPAPLAPEVRQRLASRIVEHSAVVDSMPAHPYSERVLAGLTGIVRMETDASETEALRSLAVHFGDSSVGLYALQRLLETDASRGFCEMLCTEYPQRRVACLALEHLLSTPGETVAHCDTYRSLHPGSRLAAFAALRKGDAYRATGNLARAARWYLEAGFPAADTAVMRPALVRLQALWQDHRQWPELLLFSGRDRGMPVPPSLWERTCREARGLAEDGHAEAEELRHALWHPNKETRKTLERFFREEDYPSEWQNRALLALSKLHLEAGRIDVSAALLEILYDRLPAKEAGGEAYASLGIAVFLFGDTASYGKTPPKEVSKALEQLLMLGRLAAIRERFLGLAEGSYALLCADEQAYFGNLVARRHMDELNVSRALHALARAAQLECVSPALKQFTATQLSRIHTTEYYNKLGTP